MGKEAQMMMTCAVLCMVVMAVPLQAQEISCQTVVDDLIPCEKYLKEGGNLPAECCSGVSSLNNAANTPAQRKIACQCLKVAAKAYQVNPQYASTLPADCHVNIPYPISYSTDLFCFSVPCIWESTIVVKGSRATSTCSYDHIWSKIRQPPTYRTLISFLLFDHFNRSSRTAAPQASSLTLMRSSRRKRNRESTFPLEFGKSSVPNMYNKNVMVKSSLPAWPRDSSFSSRAPTAIFLFHNTTP